MLLPRSLLLWLSPQARAAVTSLAIGFVTAVLMVRLLAVFGAGGLRKGMFVEDDVTSPEKDIDRKSENYRLDGGVDDEGAVARSLTESVRIVCCVMTEAGGSDTSAARHVQDTWGRRCNKLFFASDRDDTEGETPIVMVDQASQTVSAFDYMFKNYIEDGDWFLQADDQTYIVMENLRYFLSPLNSEDPVYMRHHFSAATQRGYLGAGSGYILSKGALTRFGDRQRSECSFDDDVEDRQMGSCLRKLGMKTVDSRDALGRSRFHCFPPENYIHGGFPDWYMYYNRADVHAGIETISDYAISFHYIPVNKFPELEFYIYRLQPYGHVPGMQSLNRGQLRRKKNSGAEDAKS